MAKGLRNVFGSRRARSIGRMARRRAGRGGIRSMARMARSRRGMGRVPVRRMARSSGRGLFGFGARGTHRRGGLGRMGLLASLGALVLGGIFGGRRYVGRANRRIGSRDVSRSQSRPNVPTSDY